MTRDTDMPKQGVSTATRAQDSSAAVPGRTSLRALAHPLRWQLIDLLDSTDQATATQCAEALGETVASCAYHLSILGKYGYARQVAGHVGREKPWELTDIPQNLSSAGSDPADARMAEAAVDAFLDHELTKLKNRFRQLSQEPAEWRDGTGVLGETTWLTAAELSATWAAIKDLVLKFADRDRDPSRRPEGAREVRLFAASSVAPQRAAVGSSPASSGG
jgi:hypothetical protein